jgi:EmrB/QacA subfamily drug resistance transporter
MPSSPPTPSSGSGATVSTRTFLHLFSAVMLPLFMAVVDQTLLATATPSIVRELGGLRDAAWIALSYLIAMTITAPLYGRLGDQHGRRDTLLVALLVFGSGSLVCSLAGTLTTLIAGRCLQGLGAGGLIVLSQAMIGEVVPPRERGRFQAYFATNYSLGSMGGPLIGGMVVQHTSWRWLFLINLPLCVLAAWRLKRLPRQRPSIPGNLTDIPGLFLFASAVTISLIWVSFAGHRFPWTSLLGLSMALVSFLLWVLLVLVERRHPEPFLPVALLQIPAVARMVITVVCFGAALFSLVFFLPLFLQLAHGHDASAAGLLLLPVTGGIVIGATLTGRLISRFGRPGWLPVAGMSLSTGGLLALALASDHGRSLGVIELICGVGLGSVMPTAQIVVQAAAGLDRLGAATALVSLSRATGAALGTAAFGALIFASVPAGDLAIIDSLGRQAHTGASVALVPQATALVMRHAFQLAFAATALIALGGLLTAWPLRKLRI